MDKMEDEAASKFINALIKSVQTLCHGYLSFDNGIEIIGHINLSVDKGITSHDYILKEKVCKNAENSTLFISNSFHAEPKGDQEVPAKNSQSNQGVSNRQVSEAGDGRVTSAISSISSALSGSRERSRRNSGAKDSDSSHSIQSTAKRKASDDHSSDFRPAKVSHSNSHSPLDSFSHNISSPLDSKDAIHRLGVSEVDMSETMLPQTANVIGDSSGDIGVNLAGSVLEPVDEQSNPDLPDRDDDSDGDLEVTFIKEEYVEGERSACDYDNSGGQQYLGGPHQRGSEGMPDPSLYPVALHSSSAPATYVPSATGQHYPAGNLGPSTSQSQPGPSSMRGISGVQSFVNSLSAFGPHEAPTLPLDQILAGPGTSRQKKGLPQMSRSNLSYFRQKHGYSNSHWSLQRAFALYRDDRRKKRSERKEEENKSKDKLELMSAGYRQLLERRGFGSSSENYKKTLEREKRRVAKKMYRATLSELKKDEIKRKDKERKRMKRSLRNAQAESMNNIIKDFSMGLSSDGVSNIGSSKVGLGEGLTPVGSSFTPVGSSFTPVGSSCMGLTSIHNIPELGLGVNIGAHRLNPGSVANIPSLASSSVGNVPWIEPVSFDTIQDDRDVESTGGREGVRPLKVDEGHM